MKKKVLKKVITLATFASAGFLSFASVSGAVGTTESIESERLEGTLKEIGFEESTSWYSLVLCQEKVQVGTMSRKSTS